MQLDDRTGPFQIAFPGGNSTAATIVEPVPTLTRPSGDGVIDFHSEYGGVAAQKIRVVPYGVGTAAQTLLMNLYGWRYLPPRVAGNQGLWVPVFLSSYTCTLCTIPGLAGADVNASQLFCGTIVVVKGGVSGTDYSILSPTGNSMASFWQAVYGSSMVSIVTGLNSSSTSVNALVAVF